MLVSRYNLLDAGMSDKDISSIFAGCRINCTYKQRTITSKGNNKHGKPIDMLVMVKMFDRDELIAHAKEKLERAPRNKSINVALWSNLIKAIEELK